MNSINLQSNTDTADSRTRIAFQTVAIVSLAIVLGERAWRLRRDFNKMNSLRGRG